MKLDLKGATVARLLTVYLAVLVCGLAVAALLIIEAAVDAPAGKSEAEADIVSAASPPPEDRPAGTPASFRSGLEWPVTSASAAPLDPRRLPPRDDEPPPFPDQHIAVIDNPPAVADSSPQITPPADAPTTFQAAAPIPDRLASVTSPPDKILRKVTRSAVGYEQPRRLRIARSAIVPRIIELMPAPPASAGCPAGSDPRLSAPDAIGERAVICHPYYRRVAVDPY